MAAPAGHLGPGGDRPGPRFPDPVLAVPQPRGRAAFRPVALAVADPGLRAATGTGAGAGAGRRDPEDRARRRQIGRASCRERVCQYVEITVVAVSVNKKAKATSS